MLFWTKPVQKGSEGHCDPDTVRDKNQTAVVEKWTRGQEKAIPIYININLQMLLSITYR